MTASAATAPRTTGVPRALVSWALLLATLLLVALDRGWWSRTEEISGPFNGEAGQALMAPVGRSGVLSCCVGARSDDNGRPQQSRLRLWVNGAEYATPHGYHDRMRAGESGVFSHWDGHVRFALPQGVANDASARLRVHYPMQPGSRWLTGVLAALGAAGWLLLQWRWFAQAWVSSLQLLSSTSARGFAAVQTAGGLRAANWALLALTLATLALESGLLTRNETLKGPFPPEGPTATFPDNKAVAATPRPYGPFGLLQARGDSGSRPQASGLKLTVAGQPYGFAHADHDRIRSGEVGAFSHWRTGVRFALPPGAANGPETTITVSYPVQPATPFFTQVLLFLAAAGWLALNWARLTEDRVVGLLRLPTRTLMALVYAGIAFTALFAAASLIAWIAGAALPTAALIRRFPPLEWLASHETRLPYVLILLAVLASLAHWAAHLSVLPENALELDRTRLERLLKRWGFPLLAAALIFGASVPWAGVLRPGDFGGASLLGLVAFNDAGAYFADAHDQARDGIWSSISVRRPLAAAARTTLMFFGAYSYPLMVIIQVTVLAAATAFAACAVARWKGVWAAIAFAAIVMIVARSFLTASLTEMLGLILAVAAVPLFVGALQTGSVRLALLGFTALSVALSVRMGSMFTIPALLLWLVACFAATTRDRIRLGIAGAAALIGIYAVNALLTRIYTANLGLGGSNLAHTLCGLSIGDVWSACQTRYLPELKGDQSEKALVDLLYAKFWENLKAQPSVFFMRLISGVGEFFSTLPGTLLDGYISAPPPFWFPSGLVRGLLLVSAVASVVLSPPTHRIFWALLWASVIASSAIVIFDDGRRVLIASYPLLALFFVMGIGIPGWQAQSRLPSPALVRHGAIGLAVLAGVLLIVPALAHLAGKPRGTDQLTQRANPSEHIVLGGRRIAGLNVVPDGEPLAWGVPTIRLGDFQRIVRQSQVEVYQGLVTPKVPPMPFAFVAAPRAELKINSYHRYIVPPHVLERRDVTHWVFTVEEWQRKPPYGPYWFLVTKAEPLKP